MNFRYVKVSSFVTLRLPANTRLKELVLVVAPSVQLYRHYVAAKLSSQVANVLNFLSVGTMACIADLLQSVSSPASRVTVLRSATRSDFQVSRTRLKFGELAFSVAAVEQFADARPHSRQHRYL